jgi:pepF/M3 family oligoendopeptidase
MREGICMNQRWSLDELYTSFESEAFKADMDKCLQGIEEIRVWAEGNLQDTAEPVEKIEKFITLQNGFYKTYTRLLHFAELTQSVEAKNEKSLQVTEKLEQKAAELTQPEVAFQKWISSLENLDGVIRQSSLIKEHEFYIREVYRKSKHMLSEKEEVLIAKMKNTGSNAWARLQELLTSTVLVDITIDGVEKQLPLPVVRNMAYEKEEKARKTAYEAELKVYKKFEDSSAACLNGIKGEVITLGKMRGYSSSLEKTLSDSRMQRETLDAMMTAIRESLPDFHRYYRKKAELMGYKNGLPFYSLFAPMGEVNMQYTYEEAADFIVKNFRTFSGKLADFAEHAFTHRWIDAEPREGKRGGAFCSNLHAIGESRFLSNFTGSFSNVTTLAHELGHGYHGACLMQETFLNSHYPMPIAETASIFCETIVTNAALKTANEGETFAILENMISDAGQVIVDIYSRFLFESWLFERREEGSLSVNELKELMLKAQKEAYGNGLDHSLLHPNMWTCKPHYYYADYNFYNFPYAFGQLFALGLYAEYLKRGSAFAGEYDKLLSVTGKKSIEDVAAIMNIDVRSADYWRSSLKLIRDDIDKFVSMK